MGQAETLERIVPEQIESADRAGMASLALHRDRYRFAAAQALPGRLLDLACGVGYGTRMLAEARPDLVDLLGVDLSIGAIDYAARIYANQRVRYEQGDGLTFGVDASESFDTIVSLETIEHLPEPDRFFARLCVLLRPGGRLIASVPTTPSVDLNPHHQHDFTRASFRAMGEREGLVERAEHVQVQRVSIGELARRDRRFRREQLRPDLLGYYAKHPGAFVRRIATTLRHGLANEYLTLSWTKPS